jgi:hypothetical protein
MPELTRRRDQDRDQENWLIYFGDVGVGHIGHRAAVPYDAPLMGLGLRLLSGHETRRTPHRHRRDIRGGARQFRASMRAATRTEADYQAWRDQRDWTAWKYRMHDAHLPLPTQRRESITRCFCGEAISNGSIDRHVSRCTPGHAPHPDAASSPQG